VNGNCTKSEERDLSKKRNKKVLNNVVLSKAKRSKVLSKKPKHKKRFEQKTEMSKEDLNKVKQEFSNNQSFEESEILISSLEISSKDWLNKFPNLKWKSRYDVMQKDFILLKIKYFTRSEVLVISRLIYSILKNLVQQYVLPIMSMYLNKLISHGHMWQKMLTHTFAFLIRLL
jgi:hypothetical protein